MSEDEKVHQLHKPASRDLDICTCIKNDRVSILSCVSQRGAPDDSIWIVMRSPKPELIVHSWIFLSHDEHSY